MLPSHYLVRRFLGANVAMGVALMVGCAPQDGRVAIEGQVTVDGVALTEGSIGFSPANGGAPSSGGFIEKGAFSLPASQGLVPGIYHVQIIASQATGRTIQDPQKGAIAELAPVRFAIPPSDITVEAGKDNRFTISLSSAKR